MAAPRAHEAAVGPIAEQRLGADAHTGQIVSRSGIAPSEIDSVEGELSAKLAAAPPGEVVWVKQDDAFEFAEWQGKSSGSRAQRVVLNP